MLIILHPLSLRWTEGSAKHTVEWAFRGGQREPVIEAIFKAVKDTEESYKAEQYEISRDRNPDWAMTCPTCHQNKPSKNEEKDSPCE